MQEDTALVLSYRATGLRCQLPAGTYVVLSKKQASSRPLAPVEGEDDLYEALATIEFKEGEVVGLVEVPGKASGWEEVVPDKKAKKAPGKAVKVPGPTDADKADKDAQTVTLGILMATPLADLEDEQIATLKSLIEGIPEAERTQDESDTLAILSQGE